MYVSVIVYMNTWRDTVCVCVCVMYMNECDCGVVCVVCDIAEHKEKLNGTLSTFDAIDKKVKGQC